jgi:hypothetical protein
MYVKAFPSTPFERRPENQGGALAMHAKVGDPLIRSLPTILMRLNG